MNPNDTQPPAGVNPDRKIEFGEYPCPPAAVPAVAVPAAATARRRPYRYSRKHCLAQAILWLRRAITRKP